MRHVYLIELEIGLRENSCSATCVHEELIKRIYDKKVVVYFYISNAVEECRLISDDFAKFYDRLQETNTEVIGVSKDSIDSCREFKEKHNLPFELISDCNNEISKAFKVGQDVDGVAGIKRKTFLFNDEGKLYHEWRNTNADDHASSVLYIAKSMGGF